MSINSGHAPMSAAWVTAAALCFSAASHAQPAQPSAKQPAPVSSSSTSNKGSPTAAIKAAVTRPAWVELTPMQQQALKPLASSWDTGISAPQKRKWLEVSKNFPTMPPDGQATMHSRMNEWVTLSPEQRAQARLNFAKTKELSEQLTPEEKRAKWQTYQALSAEEKARLAAQAPTKTLGAAPAVKPVAPQKLAAVPPHAGSQPEPGKPASKMLPVQNPAGAASSVR